MEGIRDWVIGIVCAALAAALADSLSPKGTVKKIGAFTGALVLLIAVLQPAARWKDFDLEDVLENLEAEMTPYSDQLERENENLMKEIIAEKTGAYIVDKAAELGFSCTVRVEVRQGEDGTPLPWSVEITGSYTPGQKDALVQVVAGTLDIPAERQTYRWEEVK